MLPASVGIAFVGKLDNKDELGTAVAAITWRNVSALAVGFGHWTRYIMFSNPWTGKTKQMGIHMQTALVIMGITFIPMFILNFWGGF